MKRMLRTAYEILALAIGLGVLGIVCLGWAPMAFVLRGVQSKRSGGRLGRFVNMTVLRFYLWTLSATRAMRFDISALDALRGQEPMIIAPNHPRLLDAFLVISRLPNVVCIMKQELMDNVFLRHGARLARYIGNHSLMQMIRDSVQTLHEGNHLLLFPEGTRTVREPVNDFTAAVGLVSSRGKVPVQTVFIECDSPYLRKGWPLFKRPTLPITFRVRLGQRFDPPQDVRAFTRELQQYFNDELTAVAAVPATRRATSSAPQPVSANLANPTT